MTGTTGSPELRIPRGDLLRSRVVSDVGTTTLARALDRELTGYATLVPQETLLLEGDDARGVVTFADGVPVLAYNTVSDGGPDALAESSRSRAPIASNCTRSRMARSRNRPRGRRAPRRPAPRRPNSPTTKRSPTGPRRRPEERLDAGRDDDSDAVAAFLEDDERTDRSANRRAQRGGRAGVRVGLDDALAEGTEAISSNLPQQLGRSAPYIDHHRPSSPLLDGAERLRRLVRREPRVPTHVVAGDGV